MNRVGIPQEKWVATCVLVDKLDKVQLSSLSKEVEEIGLRMETMEELVRLLSVSFFSGLVGFCCNIKIVILIDENFERLCADPRR